MENKLAIIQKDKIPELIDIEKKSGFITREPTIAIRDNVIYLTASAVEKLNLRMFKRVKLRIPQGVDAKEADKVYFFVNNNMDDDERKNYKVLHDKRGTGATISGCKSLFWQLPRLGAYKSSRAQLRRIKLKYCDKYQLWYAELLPNFENKIQDILNVKKLNCIYMIMFKGVVQAIGETNNLKRRLNEKYKDIPYDEIYYSPMNTVDEKMRKYWEWFHLEKYHDTWKQYPRYNEQGGHNPFA